MKNWKIIVILMTLSGLFACTDLVSTKKTPPKSIPKKSGYLKDNISQAELNNPRHYKKYYYRCKNFESRSVSYLAAYFPLSKESRLKENFGIYFQLDGGKAEPFDHIENKALNARGSRFEVVYRSYHPIQGSHVELVAHQHASTYYKMVNGVKTAWLECREG